MKLTRVLIMILIIVVFSGYATQANAGSLILTDEQNKWLDENSSSISFAPEQDFPPMIWSKYGVVSGISQDYFDYIQQLIDVRFPIREPRKLSEILGSVKTGGEKSIVSSRTMTPERSEYLLFTRPYFSSPSIFISKNKKTITGTEIEEKGYTVAVGNLFGTHEYLKNRYPKMKLEIFDNHYQAILAMMNDQVDIVAIDSASLMYLIKENNFSGIRKVGDTGFVAQFAFAVPKNLPLLRDILDNAIEVIPLSFKESVLEKWGVNSSDVQLLTNRQVFLTDVNNVGAKNITILVVGMSLLIIFIEFILHRYFFRRGEKEVLRNNNI